MSLRLNRAAMAFLTAVLMNSGACLAADAELEKARALLADGKPDAAYTILQAREFDMAGNVEFDTMLGVAALDSGKPDRATLAFERVLAVDPNAEGTRLDLARAYFALGDLDRAKQEFDVVSQNNPPPAAQSVIDKYRAAIAERERKKTTSVTGYIEGFVGYDSNITAVVGDFSSAVLATYNLAGFQPTGNSILRSSATTGLVGGFEVTHQVNDAWALSVGGDARWRDVARYSDYSSGQVDLRGSATYTKGKDAFRVGVTLESFDQRTDIPTNDRNAVGANFEWRHTYSDRDQGSAFLVVTRQRYPDIAVDDVNSVLGGFGWLHQFDGDHKPLLYASISAGEDYARNQLDNGSDYSRRYTGGRLYGQWSVKENADMFLNLGLLERSDQSPYARSILIEFGDDHIADSTIGLNWRPRPHWTIRPQMTYTDNRSNVPLSVFHRTEATLTARYDFY
jgi:tetratricopeptide (TPR) repeat protein